MNSTSFVFYDTFAQQILQLDDALQLKFYRAIVDYGLHGQKPDFTGLELAAWIPIQDAIDRAQERRDMRAEAGRKGGKQNKAPESKPKQNEADANNTKANESKTKQNEANESKAEQHESKPKVNVDVNVDDDVNADVVVDADAAASDNNNNSLYSKIKKWCINHDMAYDEQTYSLMMTAVVCNHDDIQYLDYVADVISHRVFSGKRYTDKTPDEQRVIFRAAVTEWADLAAGFPAWLIRRDAADHHAVITSARASPPSCPVCGNPAVILNSDQAGCKKCGVLFEFENGAWKRCETFDEHAMLEKIKRGFGLYSGRRKP